MCGDGNSIRVDLVDCVQPGVDFANSGGVGLDQVYAGEMSGIEARLQLIKRRVEQRREFDAATSEGTLAERKRVCYCQ